ncbi:MAG: FeoC-like transcriptional regulator [Hyphomicrobiales bacterium]|nr:FeoC-like transcriptional regulator [Hyphomicrobiales bacterium]MCP5370222.1 FeoC-like transcriptional regulator [Hyphomicrobiales bacterium]
MILSELRAYLSEHGRAGIGDLANRFDADPDAIRGMLSHFIRKGRVRKLENPAGDCGGCSKCDAFALEVYEWTE